MGSLNSEEEVEQMGDELNESTSYVPHLEGFIHDHSFSCFLLKL